MPPFDRAHRTSYSTSIKNHASILNRFRDIASYLSKVADFDPPHLHLAPSQGVILVEFRGDLWHQRTRVPGLSCGVVCVILHLTVLVELRLVTDRQTDRHRAMASTAESIASCGKNRSILLEQSFTAHPALLMATGTFGSGRCLSSTVLSAPFPYLHLLMY